MKNKREFLFFSFRKALNNLVIFSRSNSQFPTHPTPAPFSSLPDPHQTTPPNVFPISEAAHSSQKPWNHINLFSHPPYLLNSSANPLNPTGGLYSKSKHMPAAVVPAGNSLLNLRLHLPSTNSTQLRQVILLKCLSEDTTFLFKPSSGFPSLSKRSFLEKHIPA